MISATPLWGEPTQERRQEKKDYGRDHPGKDLQDHFVRMCMSLSPVPRVKYWRALEHLFNLRGMKPKSPFDQVGGMAYFPRMLDKIRLHAAGALDSEYHENLGKGADARCTGFLRVGYEDLRARVLEGGSDEELLEWCYANGRRLDAGDAKIWTGFITKLGWNDAVAPYLEKAKAAAGLSHRDDIQSMPQLMDAEEGRDS